MSKPNWKIYFICDQELRRLSDCLQMEKSNDSYWADGNEVIKLNLNYLFKCFCCVGRLYVFSTKCSVMAWCIGGPCGLNWEGCGWSARMKVNEIGHLVVSIWKCRNGCRVVIFRAPLIRGKSLRAITGALICIRRQKILRPGVFVLLCVQGLGGLWRTGFVHGLVFMFVVLGCMVRWGWGGYDEVEHGNAATKW